MYTIAVIRVYGAKPRHWGSLLRRRHQKKSESRNGMTRRAGKGHKVDRTVPGLGTLHEMGIGLESREHQRNAGHHEERWPCHRKPFRRGHAAVEGEREEDQGEPEEGEAKHLEPAHGSEGQCARPWYVGGSQGLPPQPAQKAVLGEGQNDGNQPEHGCSDHTGKGSVSARPHIVSSPPSLTEK